MSVRCHVQVNDWKSEANECEGHDKEIEIATLWVKAEKFISNCQGCLLCTCVCVVGGVRRNEREKFFQVISKWVLGGWEPVNGSVGI